MALNLNAFDKADSDRIRRSLLADQKAAIAEWPRTGIGRSPAADGALVDLYAAYEQVQPNTATQKTFLPTSFANLDKISQPRTERILQARTDTGPPWPLWAVIFVTSGMVIGSVVTFGVEKPAIHYPMVAIVGVLVAANLFLLFELAHPFTSAVLFPTSSDPLREAATALSQPHA